MTQWQLHFCIVHVTAEHVIKLEINEINFVAAITNFMQDKYFYFIIFISFTCCVHYFILDSFKHL